MKYLIFGDENQEAFNIALLIKEAGLQEHSLNHYYLEPLQKRGIEPEEIVAFGCPYNEKNKAPTTDIKEFFAALLPQLDEAGITTVLIADSAYFKVLAGQRKAEGNYGKVLPCAIQGFEHLDVVIIPNYQALLHNPALESKITVALDTLANHMYPAEDFHKPTSVNVRVLSGPDEIYEGLQSLLNEPELAVDIEGYSLEFHKAGIATIAFAKDKENAITFVVDAVPDTSVEDCYHRYEPNLEIHQILRDFFDAYQGMFIFHNATYDLKILIFNLWMDRQLGNNKGIIDGIFYFYGHVDDTKILTYLATNNAVKNELDLKSHALDYVGAYSMGDDIQDIRKIPLDTLLEYNGIDTGATVYVKEKHMPTVVADNQLYVYEEIFQPSIMVVLQMELTGMPMCRLQTMRVHKKLKQIRKKLLKDMRNDPVVKSFTKLLRKEESDKCHAKWKVKTAPIEHFDYVKYNPNSANQTRKLLYDYLEFPVLDKTKGKQASTKGPHIKKLLNHTDSEQYKRVIQLHLEYADVKILIQNFTSTFITKMVKHTDGHWWLHGNFNLGGTISGRMSSSDPNLQNIPSSGNPFAKLIKSCFVAPPDWIMGGADFASLEDRISALLTKDPNKIRVYTDGYDSHSLRALFYFSDKFPHLFDKYNKAQDATDFYKVTVDGKTKYYTKDDLPEEAKKALNL